MKRALALLLLLSLFAAPAAFAQESAFVASAAFFIPSAYGGKSASLPLDDRFFTQPNDQYHHGLARISLAMAVSAFRGAAAAPDAPIRSFFDQLGFGLAQAPDQAAAPGVQTWDYPAPGEDTVGTAVAWRYLMCFESPVPLVAVAVCGGNYGDEWAGNLDFGLEGDHAGFARAAEKVVERVREFERENGLSDEMCVYWLAGYGRGGAICSQAAALMAEQSGDRLFCYTFASPLTTAQPRRSLNGIYNIVSASDPLCALPPADWGFGRHGRTLYLPSSLDTNHDYAALLSGYSQVFEQFSGRADAVGDRDLATMARAAVAQLTQSMGSRSAFPSSCAPLLFKVFTGRSLGARDMLSAYSLLGDVGKAARAHRRYALPPLPGSGGLGPFASEEVSALYAQHDPAVYAAWMLSLPEGNVLTDSTLALTDTPWF